MNNHQINEHIVFQKKQGKTWEEIILGLQLKGIILTKDAVRKRYKRTFVEDNDTTQESNHRETIQYNNDGTIEAEKIVNLAKHDKDDANAVLKAMGYNPNNWEIISLQISSWMQHTKEQVTKQLYAVKCKLAPIKKLTTHDATQSTLELFKQNLNKLDIKIDSKANNDTQTYNHDRLLEYPPLELHLGKLAHIDEVGENYNTSIAKRIFEQTIKETIELQQTQQCATLLYVVGSDFFNSDTVNGTTTRGTQQSNDIRWKQMFEIGLKLHIEAILTLKEHFHNVEVMMTSGNHCEMSIYYLYVALQAYFKNSQKVKFKQDYKTTQAFVFGDCAIFYNHGDSKIDRLKKSICVEFSEIWGNTVHRELHLGHFHKEIVYDDEGGMITRRIGSPSGTDNWHYNERYLGASKVHQLFVWEKNKGVTDMRYIKIANSEYGEVKT